MKGSNSEPNEELDELPDEWWYKVYAGVIVTTAAVITLLWIFSQYFSG